MGKMKTLAVTRPVGEGADTSSLIRARGWRPLLIHTVELKPRPTEEIGRELTQIFSAGAPDCIVFMSPKGARLFFEAATKNDELVLSASKLSRIVAVGPKTASSLTMIGAANVEIPSSYSSEGVAEFLSKTQLQGNKIILARSSQANDLLETRLKALGASVLTLRLYDSILPYDRSSVFEYIRELRSGGVTATLFTSSSSATNLFRMNDETMSATELKGLLGKCVVGAIGSSTSTRLGTLGISEVVVPKQFVIAEAVTSLIETVETKSLLVS